MMRIARTTLYVSLAASLLSSSATWLLLITVVDVGVTGSRTASAAAAAFVVPSSSSHQRSTSTVVTWHDDDVTRTRRRSCSCSHSRATRLQLLSSCKATNDDDGYANNNNKQSSSRRNNEKKTAVVAGATGYIGRAVVKEAVARGYTTYALVRSSANSNSNDNVDEFNGAVVMECDVTDPVMVQQCFERIAAATAASANDDEAQAPPIDTIVSCLASRAGTKRDAFAIDYQATLNCLEAGQTVQARHFVVLSAICVRNPWLQFQKAKLKFEAALQAQTAMTYSIVRPTAFFKSVSGQVEVVQSGSPYVLFEDGELTRCNPIAEHDLATYMMDCAVDPGRVNQILNIGGPGGPLTQKQQAQMVFRAVGRAAPHDQEYFHVSIAWFDTIINVLQWLADVTGLEQIEDWAETGRIGKYYAVEDMLTTRPEEKFGTTTLQEHYDRIAREGQEYDPYVADVAQFRARVLSLLPKVVRTSDPAQQQLQQQHQSSTAATTAAPLPEALATTPRK